MKGWRSEDIRTIAVVAALVVIAIIGAAVSGGGDGDRTVKVRFGKTVVPSAVAVDGPDRNAKPDRPLELDREARALVRRAARAPGNLDLAGDLRGADRTPVAEHEGPLATPNFPGCRTRILPTNWSNRVSSVRAVAWHYTAGGNLPGLADMNGLTGYASSPSAGVSWHFLIDAEGHCYYSVPLGKKAWTIGNLNSQTVNIEVVGRGNEPAYPANVAGRRKLFAVTRRIGRIYGIPMRWGSTDGRCNVARPGIITHWQGGPCSGGHHDIRPYSISRLAAQVGGPLITKAQRRRCAELNRLRRKAKRPGVTLSRRQRARGRAIRRGFRRNGLRCLYPPKRGRFELVSR